jgi:hypothetical protein
MKIINQLRHGMNNNISDVTLLCRLKLWAVITITFIRTTLIVLMRSERDKIPADVFT